MSVLPAQELKKVSIMKIESKKSSKSINQVLNEVEKTCQRLCDLDNEYYIITVGKGRVTSFRGSAKGKQFILTQSKLIPSFYDYCYSSLKEMEESESKPRPLQEERGMTPIKSSGNVEGSGKKDQTTGLAEEEPSSAKNEFFGSLNLEQPSPNLASKKPASLLSSSSLPKIPSSENSVSSVVSSVCTTAMKTATVKTKTPPAKLATSKKGRGGPSGLAQQKSSKRSLEISTPVESGRSKRIRKTPKFFEDMVFTPLKKAKTERKDISENKTDDIFEDESDDVDKFDDVIDEEVLDVKDPDFVYEASAKPVVEAKYTPDKETETENTNTNKTTILPADTALPGSSDNDYPEKVSVKDQTPKRVKKLPSEKAKLVSHRCMTCSISFPSLEALKEHKKEFHNINFTPFEKFTCSECKEEFDKKFYLHMHKMEVHQNKCYDCKNQFDDQDQLMEHKNVCKTMYLEKKISCSLCQKFFRTQNDMDTHIKNDHTLGLICKLCNVVNKGMTLKEHRKNDCIFTKDDQSKCLYCQIEYKKGSALTAHVYMHDNAALVIAAMFDISVELAEELFLNSFKSKPKEVVLDQPDRKPQKTFAECAAILMGGENARVEEAATNSECSIEPGDDIKQEEQSTLSLEQCHDSGEDLQQKVQNFDLSQQMCLLCVEQNPKFTSNTDVMRHAITHRFIICDDCGEFVSSQKDRKRHKNECHGENFHICQVCKEKFEQLESLIKHRSDVHLGNVMKQQLKDIKCRTCEKLFANTILLRRHHLALKHDDAQDRMFRCEICPNRTFKEKGLYTRHMQHCHSTERPYTCSTCGKKFSTQKYLRNHERTNHTQYNKKKAQCEYCKKYFTQTYLLRMHMQIHYNNRKFVCEYCGDSFLQKGSLKKHQLTVHSQETPFDCDICPQKFKLKELYKIHMREHIIKEGRIEEVGNKYGRFFPCKHCGKVFPSSRHLISHSWSHDPHARPRPFVCLICQKAFPTRSKMLRHMKSHGPSKMNEFVCIKKKPIQVDPESGKVIEPEESLVMTEDFAGSSRILTKYKSPIKKVITIQKPEGMKEGTFESAKAVDDAVESLQMLLHQDQEIIPAKALKEQYKSEESDDGTSSAAHVLYAIEQDDALHCSTVLESSRAIGDLQAASSDENAIVGQILSTLPETQTTETLETNEVTVTDSMAMDCPSVSVDSSGSNQIAYRLVQEGDSIYLARIGEGEVGDEFEGSTIVLEGGEEEIEYVIV